MLLARGDVNSGFKVTQSRKKYPQNAMRLIFLPSAYRLEEYASKFGVFPLFK